MTRYLVWMTHGSTLLTLRQACKKAEKNLNEPLKLHGTYLKIYSIQCNDMLWVFHLFWKIYIYIILHISICDMMEAPESSGWNILLKIMFS